jgi:hypothetical protein
VRCERVVLVARFALVVTTAALLFSTPNLNAQQSTRTSEARQDVPENLAEHAPPVQPLPYSHKTHLALGLECQACHTNPDPGNLMTFPAIATCMSCHNAIAKNKPTIQKLASFAKSNQTIPWVRVYSLTPGVTWSHRKHIAAGLKCETCHGQVAEMSAMSQTTSVTSMGVCINCHKLHNAPTVCQTCHVWPSS